MKYFCERVGYFNYVNEILIVNNLIKNLLSLISEKLFQYLHIAFFKTEIFGYNIIILFIVLL